MSATKPLTPNGERLLVALYELDQQNEIDIDAAKLAHETGLGRGIRRAGHGAVKGSWSGEVDPAFIVGRMLVALPERGYAWVHYGYRSKKIYRISSAGSKEAKRIIGEGVTAKHGRGGPTGS